MLEQDEKARKNLEANGDVQFYYSREERLERMPNSAKLYNGELSGNKGFFNVLVKAPGGKFMILAIVILVAVILILGVFNRQNEDSLCGVDVSLNAFLFEDTVYVTAKLNESKNFSELFGSETAEITVTFGAFDSNQSLIEEKNVTSVYNGEELALRATFTDFEIFKIVSYLQMGDNNISLSVDVEK